MSRSCLDIHILLMYSPIMPRENKIKPVEKKMATIRDVKPISTSNAIFLYMYKQPKIKNTIDMYKPIRLITLSGSVECNIKIVKAILVNFAIVYPDCPLVLSLWSTKQDLTLTAPNNK